MYHKKRVICCDKSGKIVATLTLSGDEGDVGVKISCYEDIDEVFVVGKGAERSYKLPISKATFPYSGGKIGCVLLKRGRVVAVSKGEIEPAVLLSSLERCNFKKDAPPPSKPRKEKPTVVQNKTSIPSLVQEDKTVEAEKEEKETTELKTERSEAHEEREIAHFYCSIKKNLDETFTCYPNVKLLEDMIPYSTWVEIKKEDTPYVVGLIKEGDLPKYVCYGVSSDTGHKPPDDIAKYCQWLPTDEYNGYWIIFQDADSGETIKNEE